MRYLLALLALALFAMTAEAGGYGGAFVRTGSGVLIVNNNNNNNARMGMARVEVREQRTRAFRPFLRRLAPRIALERDQRFGAPVNRFGRVLGAGGP